MPSSWKDLKSWISFNVNTGKKYYFRGQSNSKWGLETTFHRNISDTNISMDHYLTQIMKDVNYQMSVFEKPVNLTDGQEFGHLLARLQHHGFPTPLLDWTLSPYIAAYFAFKEASISPKDHQMVSIYIFDIDLWVSKFRNQNDLLREAGFISDFVPFATDNPRMARQMGVTTLTNVPDIQSFIMSVGKSLGCDFLWKFEIPASERKNVMKELNLMGINDMTMFPDFDGLCAHLKEIHFNNIQKPLPIPPVMAPPQ